MQKSVQKPVSLSDIVGENNYDNAATLKSNMNTIAVSAPTWFANIRGNIPFLNTNLKTLDQYHLPKKDLSKIFLIVSGPSLNADSAFLRFLSPYFTIACPTNLSLCYAHGLYPDVVTIADSSAEHVKELNLIKNLSIPIIASPTIHPDVAKTLPGCSFYWHLSMIQIKGHLNNSYNHTLRMLFPDINEHIVQAGTVTNQALIIIYRWIKLGKLPENVQIFLVGADHAFGKESQRAYFYREIPGLHKTEDHNAVPNPERGSTFTRQPADFKPQADLTAENIGHYRGCVTNTQMWSAKQSMFLIWYSTKMRIYRTRREGILSELPIWPLSKVAKGRFPDPYPEKLLDKYFTRFSKSELPTFPYAKEEEEKKETKETDVTS